jgi:hypothetical protein
MACLVSAAEPEIKEDHMSGRYRACHFTLIKSMFAAFFCIWGNAGAKCGDSTSIPLQIINGKTPGYRVRV